MASALLGLVALLAAANAGVGAAGAPAADAGAPAADAGAPAADAGAPVADAGARTRGTAADAGAPVADAGAPAADAGARTRGTAADAGAPVAVLQPFSGVVLARGTRDPLGGATVTIDASLATDTDATGRFSLDLPPGPHTLQIVAPGYEPLALDVATPFATEPVFRLMPRLTGERFETIVVPPSEKAPRTSLRDEELRSLPGSLGDPFRTIESLPGVAQVAWPLPIYAIRGANPGNTGFFVDGTRMPALFHLALGPSIIHPFFLQQLDFYPGGYPSRYGRYVSGIVAARTVQPQTDRPRGSVDVRLFDAGGIVATPFDGGKGSAAVAGRYSYTGALFSLFSPDYKLDYWDYQTRIDHRLGPGRVTLFALGSSDDLGSKLQPAWGEGVPGTAGQRVRPWGAKLRFHRADLRWDGPVGRGRVEAGLVGSLGSSATYIPQLFGRPLSAGNKLLAPRVIYAQSIARWLDVEAGADGEAQTFTPSSEGVVGTSSLFKTRTAYMSGAFVEATVRVRDRVVFSPGVRYDLFAESGAWVVEPSPRLHVRVRPAGDVWLKGTVGRFAQLPSLALAIPGFENFGLGTYGLQQSWQASGGVEVPLHEGVSFDATGFYQRFRLTDIRSIVGGGDLQEVEFLEVRDGESYGGELLIRRPATYRLSGWLSYTLSWSYRLVGFYQGKAPSDWDQRHVLNLVGKYRLGRGYSVGGRFHLNTGRLYPVFSKAINNVEGYRRLPTYHQLDLRADKRFILDRYVLDVYVEMLNTMRTREIFDTYRETDGALVETSFPISFPSIGLHAEW